jgi:NAD(P)-dependent dehydrogenase (short-subunit alcohol dehydrogenase family)
MFSNELARRYGAEGIVSTSLHPGIIKTDLTRHLKISSLMQRAGNMFSYDVSYGAITSLYAGTAPAAGELNGKVRTDCICLRISPHVPAFVSRFLVSYSVGTRRGSEQVGARSRACEEAVGVV